MKSLGNDVFEAEKLRLAGKKVFYRLNSGSDRHHHWTLCDGPVPENMTDFDWCVEEE